MEKLIQNIYILKAKALISHAKTLNIEIEQELYDKIAENVNKAYEFGEDGMWKEEIIKTGDGPEDFITKKRARTNQKDIKTFIDNDQMILAIG